MSDAGQSWSEHFVEFGIRTSDGCLSVALRGPSVVISNPSVDFAQCCIGNLALFDLVLCRFMVHVCTFVQLFFRGRHVSEFLILHPNF